MSPPAVRHAGRGCALTFDDGPDPTWTPVVLDALDRAGASATFFVVGPRASRQRALVTDMLARGHDVELHCWHHVRHTELTEAQLGADTDRGLLALAELGVRAAHWRAPWGVLSDATRRVAGARSLSLVGWDADTHDWRGDTAAQMHAAVARLLRPGAVVLMHDGLGPGARRADCRETVALIPRLAAELHRLDLAPRRLSELAS